MCLCVFGLGRWCEGVSLIGPDFLGRFTPTNFRFLHTFKLSFARLTEIYFMNFIEDRHGAALADVVVVYERAERKKAAGVVKCEVGREISSRTEEFVFFSKPTPPLFTFSHIVWPSPPFSTL